MLLMQIIAPTHGTAAAATHASSVAASKALLESPSKEYSFLSNRLPVIPGKTHIDSGVRTGTKTAHYTTYKEGTQSQAEKSSRAQETQSRCARQKGRAWPSCPNNLISMQAHVGGTQSANQTLLQTLHTCASVIQNLPTTTHASVHQLPWLHDAATDGRGRS